MDDWQQSQEVNGLLARWLVKTNKELKKALQNEESLLERFLKNEQTSQNKDEQIDELKEQLDEVLKRLWGNEPNSQDKFATLNSQLKDKEDFINRLQQQNNQLSEISRSKDDQIDELKGQLDEVLKRFWEK